MNKDRKWIIILLVATLLVNIYQNIRISELERYIKNQNSIFNRLSDDINRIDGNVYNALNTWELENRWIRSTGYEINSISEDLESMTVSIHWDFNNLKNNEKVYLNIGKSTDKNLEDISWEKIEIESADNLHYEKQLTLPFKAYYTIEVLAENSSEMRSDKLLEIDAYNRLINRIQVDGTIRKNGDNIRFWTRLVNTNTVFNLFNDEESKVMPEQLKIHEAELDIYVKGEILETVDLIEEGEHDKFDEKDIEFLEYEKVFESPDFSQEDVEAIVRVTDNLGLEHEIEVELDR